MESHGFEGNKPLRTSLFLEGREPLNRVVSATQKPLLALDEHDVQPAPYVIQGGDSGRERLRILSGVMQPWTRALLQKVGIRPGMTGVDVGCGGGDVTRHLSTLVGPTGRVTGLDVDPKVLELASREAERLCIDNVTYRVADVTHDSLGFEYDFTYARFLLTHLSHTEQMLQKVYDALRPGGLVVIEDIDFRGCFSEPDSPAFWRYVDLHTRVMQQRGGNPYIGLRLPTLLEGAGFSQIEMNIVHPAGRYGDVKLITPLTMENIADAVERGGLATHAELQELIKELYAFANTPGTVSCLPHVVETWGIKPG